MKYSAGFTMDMVLLTLKNHACFDEVFTYTLQKSSLINFLNFKIIQSSHGISIDQLTHTNTNFIPQYFKGRDN